MIQILENLWNVVTSIFEFIVTATISILNGLLFCYNIFAQGVLYLSAFGTAAVYLLTVIMILYVVWLVLHIIHG